MASYRDLTPRPTAELFRRHGETAARAGKPTLLQEFGYSSLNADQPDVYRGLLDAVAGDPNSAGWIFWRLVGRLQRPQTRRYPESEDEPLGGYVLDAGDHFDIVDDRSAASTTAYRSAVVLREAASRASRRRPVTSSKLHQLRCA